MVGSDRQPKPVAEPQTLVVPVDRKQELEGECTRWEFLWEFMRRSERLPNGGVGVFGRLWGTW